MRGNDGKKRGEENITFTAEHHVAWRKKERKEKKLDFFFASRHVAWRKKERKEKKLDFFFASRSVEKERKKEREKKLDFFFRVTSRSVEKERKKGKESLTFFSRYVAIAAREKGGCLCAFLTGYDDSKYLKYARAA